MIENRIIANNINKIIIIIKKGENNKKMKIKTK